VDPLRRNLSTDQPSGACASEPPDPARGAYADYVERLEDQIAGGVRAGARRASSDDGEVSGTINRPRGPRRPRDASSGSRP